YGTGSGPALFMPGDMTNSSQCASFGTNLPLCKSGWDRTDSSMHATIKVALLIFFLMSTVSTAATTDEVASIQRRLNVLGYDAGSVDGVWGSNTRRALETFLEEIGLPFDGSPG